MSKGDARDLIVWSSVQFQILFGALHEKGLLSYADIQEEIAGVRDRIPKNLYSQFIEDQLNIMEATYQDGPYQSPLPKKDEPRL